MALFVGLSRIGDLARAQVLDLESGVIVKVSQGDSLRDGKVAAVTGEGMTVEFPLSGSNTETSETIRVDFPLADSETLAAQAAKRLTFENMANLAEL